jgi:formate dehydrogenase major subunit
MTRRTDDLRLRPAERVEINPQDAARVGVLDGGQVRLKSRRGGIEVRVEPTDRVQPGELFMAFHFPEVAANRLTSDVSDEATGCPRAQGHGGQRRREPRSSTA